MCAGNGDGEGILLEWQGVVVVIPVFFFGANAREKIGCVGEDAEGGVMQHLPHVLRPRQSTEFHSPPPFFFAYTHFTIAPQKKNTGDV